MHTAHRGGRGHGTGPRRYRGRGSHRPRAPAQPRRRKPLPHLSLYGPATAAILARTLGLNTGATSHHLREPARYGFFEETEGGSARRERCWRAVAGDRRSPAAQPLVYATVAGASGLLALVATALPDRAALRGGPVEVATAEQ
ncbi:hypothetical protein [Streptomyces altiplanensis]